MPTFRDLWRHRKRWGVPADAFKDRKVILCYDAMDTFLPMIKYEKHRGDDEIMNEVARLLLCVAPPFPKIFIEGKPLGRSIGFLIDQIGGEGGTSLRSTLPDGEIPAVARPIIQIAESRASALQTKWTIAFRTIDDNANGIGTSWLFLNSLGAPIDFGDGFPLVLTVSNIDWLQTEIERIEARAEAAYVQAKLKCAMIGDEKLLAEIESRQIKSRADRALILSGKTDGYEGRSTVAWVNTTLLTLALLCVQTMHCTNAALPETPLTFKRKRNADDCPVTKYSTLVITKTFGRAEKRDAEEDDQSEAAQNALHFARGHFKDFRNGPGLFGKYKALYWWGPQLRGHSLNGVVISTHATPMSL